MWWRYLTSSISTVTFLLGFVTFALADPPSIEVKLERQKIYQGESVNYQITVLNIEDPPAPDMSRLKQFEVKLLGELPINERRYININGNKSVYERFGKQFIYSLTPQKTGRLTIPVAKVTYNGTDYLGKSLVLEVIASTPQDLANVSILVDPPEVYPNQPFTVTLTVTLSALPDPLKKEDPLRIGLRTRSLDPPRLNIPWAIDDELDKALYAPVPWERWLGQLRSRGRYGFSINNVRAQTMFSLLDGAQYLLFAPAGTELLKRNLQGVQSSFWQYKIRRQFECDAVGEYDLGTATLKGNFVKDIVGGNQLRMEEVFAVAPRARVKVNEAPLTGRPANFTGVYGAIDLFAKLAPTKAKVGDPMTLTLKMTGPRSLEFAAAPNLSDIPEINQVFKVYDATEATEGDVRVFTYSLRPLSEKTTELPEISFSYFDPFNEEYKSTSTTAIPVSITAADSISSHEIQIAAKSNGASSTLETAEGGIFANVTDYSALNNQKVNPRNWLLLFVACIASYGVALGIVARLHRSSTDTSAIRRRQAPQLAQTRLQQVTESAGSSAKHSADAISSALIGLVTDLSDKSEVGVTPRDATRLLEGLGGDIALLQEFDDLLDRCDAARFGAADASISSLAQAAANTCDKISAVAKG